jgi:hypothetical protein
MLTDLSPDEQSYLQELLTNHSRSIRSLAITANLLLIFGGLLLVGTALYLSQHLTDSVVYSVGLPNFVGGILTIAAYVFLSRRVVQLKKLTSLLSKLSGMKVTT